MLKSVIPSQSQARFRELTSKMGGSTHRTNLDTVPGRNPSSQPNSEQFIESATKDSFGYWSSQDNVEGIDKDHM